MRYTKLVVLASAALLVASCASTKDLEAVKTMAQQAQSTADQALSEARSAQACCDANEEKLNRMYQKIMYK